MSPTRRRRANDHLSRVLAKGGQVEREVAEWQKKLPAFEISLLCDGRVIDRGHSENVLGGPVSALRHLIGLLARDAINPPLAAGEIVTTGTLTRAIPVKSGEPWISRQWSWVDHRGSFRNTTVNGQITGFGLDLGVIDDAIIMRFDVRRAQARPSILWSAGFELHRKFRARLV
jgi:hypothetical protein